jgi:hypothetical protein
MVQFLQIQMGCTIHHTVENQICEFASLVEPQHRAGFSSLGRLTKYGARAKPGSNPTLKGK